MRFRAVIFVALCTLAGGAAGRAQSQQAAAGTRVGIINIQDAIIRTQEGQRTAKALQEKYAPRQAELERKKRELDDLQAQLSKGRNTMSDEARNNLIRQIDQKNKALTRDNEDASAEYQQEESKLINAIGQKMMGVIDKYAKEKGYSIILDISSPNSPVLYAVNTVDITSDIVALYDKNQGGDAPATSAGPPAQAAPKAVTRPPVAPKTAPPVRPAGPPK
jgi:outer membrane protein